MSRTSFAVLAVIAFTGFVAAQQPGAQRPDAGRPTVGGGAVAGGGGGGGGVSLEQRTVDQQNQMLSTTFARAFPEDTPAEFQPLVVALYVRCQAELDNCADFLWETHLLREYRNCAMAQRRLCTQEVQELQAQLAVMADGTQEQYELSPDERELLSGLGSM